MTEAQKEEAKNALFPNWYGFSGSMCGLQGIGSSKYQRAVEKQIWRSDVAAGH
jgi:hypothetical protein